MIAGTIVLSTVRSPAKLGYTWGRLLYIAPIGIIALGFLPREEVKLPRKAF